MNSLVTLWQNEMSAEKMDSQHWGNQLSYSVVIFRYSVKISKYLDVISKVLKYENITVKYPDIMTQC